MAKFVFSKAKEPSKLEAPAKVVPEVAPEVTAPVPSPDFVPMVSPNPMLSWIRLGPRAIGNRHRFGRDEAGRFIVPIAYVDEAKRKGLVEA